MRAFSKFSHNFKTPHIIAIVVFALLAITLRMPVAFADHKEFQEYHIKAVFLYNLTHFVNWPQDNGQSKSEFVIGIYGPDPFGPLLDKVVSGESRLNRAIVIKRFKDLKELTSQPPDILFIHSTKIGESLAIHHKLSGEPVLTVADSAGFPEQGGMVNLRKKGHSIKLEINHRAALDAGLSISAKLLKLARIVK